MADQRITQLTKLAQVDVAANDVLPVVDVGASITKKVEVKELFQAGANLADSSSIDLIKLNQASTTKLGTTALADDAVTAAKLANDSSIAYDSVAPTIDNFEGRGYVNSTSKNLQVWNGTSFDQVVAPTAGIADLAVTTGKLANGAVTTAKVDAAGLAADALATNAVTTAKILNGAVTADKLGAFSVTTAKIAADAVTAAELANNSVDTAAIVDAAVTESKLATNAVSETKLANGAVTVAKIANTQITYAKLNLADGSVPGAKLVSNSVTSSQMALDSVTTSALTNLNVTTAKLADSAATTAKIADGAITTAKVDAAGLAAAAIATDAITTPKVLDGAITAAKLADDSTTIVQAGTPTGSGDFEGQLWFDTNTSVQYVWNNTAWIRQAAINVINFTDSTPIAFSVAYPNNHTADITTTLDTQAANQAFLGPATGADAAPTFRAIVPADLPDATASTKGIIQPGTGLDVNGGTLNHSNSVTAGTYTKLTVDAQGHVSAGTILEAADIPDIDAAKITTGGLVTDRLADNAVTIDKLADYSTASLGDTLPTPSFIGQIHLNPLDKAFFMWDGNVWVPIGISAGQIIFAGTFDASAGGGVGAIASLTPEGVAAGFSIGALPASSATNNKHYFVVSEGGTITSGNAPNVALAPPDLILSVWSTTSPAWVEVDVSSGAGSIAASQVSFTPTGDLGSTNVQTALAEVSSECRNATNITSGTLAVARGGTNLASYTKGDIIVASGATTLVKLPVGTNGQVLTADSAEISGLKYTTPTVGTVTDVTSATTALTVATSTTTPALTIRAATTSVDGIVQLSDSTGTTSSTLAATPTAVKAAYDLANAALPKAGGAITGELLIGNAGTLVFEGSTNDGNETTLAVADPTVDRTITLPDQTGTVLVSNNASIVNADISATAEIAVSKLADGSARQLLQTDAAGTGVEWASNIDIPGTLDVTGAATLDSTLSVPLGTAALPSIYPGTDTNTGIYSPGADQLAVSTGGTGRLFVDSSGNVGIGTSSPTAPLHVSTSGTNIANFAGPANVYADFTDGTGILRVQMSSSVPVIGTATNHPLILSTNGTERLRIDGSGNVGIGTSSPARKLDVAGGVNSTGLNVTGVGGFFNAANKFGVDNNAGTTRMYSSGPDASTRGSYDFRATDSVGTLDTSRMVIDSSGRVGIGTSSPGVLLDISAANGMARIGSSSGNNIFQAYTGSSALGMWAGGIPRFYSTGSMIFSVNSTVGTSIPTGYLDAMTIDSSGRVGIGTSSPGYALDVSATGSTISSAFRSDQSENWVALKDSGTTLGHVRLGSTSGAMLFYAGNGERLRIDSSGRLLVGTSTSRGNVFGQAVHQIEGGSANTFSSITVAENTAFGGAFVLAKTRGSSFQVVSSGDQLGILSFQGADGSVLREAARIDASVDGTPGADDMPGRLVFSTTADGASSPTERMRIASNGQTTIASAIPNPSTPVVAIDNSSNTSGTQSLTLQNRANANDTSSYYLVCQEPGVANRCFIYGNGNLANANNVYGAISDIKHKENIVDASSQWADFKNLQVRKYNLKEAEGFQGHTQIGLIAQEAEQVCPGLVFETPDRDTDGNNLGTVTKSINYSILYMKAVKALQEAMERIETLEAAVAALQSA